MTDQYPVVEIERIQHGWANITIRFSNMAVWSGPISDLSDGLGEFVTAIEQVLGGSLSGTECRWEHEPQVTSILIRRCGGGRNSVEVLIGGDDNTAWNDSAVPDFALELRTIVDLRDLARATVAAFDLVWETWGAEGYAEHWGYPFPRARLDSLVEYLRQQEENDARTRYLSELPKVLPEILCRNRTTSAELAVALDETPERVIEALRYLESIDRFQLEERDGGVAIVAGSLWPESRFMLAMLCDKSPLA